jgi:hypothetical protein
MDAINQAHAHIFPRSLKPLAAFIAISILAFTMLSDGHASDEQFSMQFQDKTLAAVFKELTRMSGRPIAFDKQWANHPINIRFANLSLEMAIAKILKNFNHVLIFEEDNIQIKIYGVVTPGEELSRTSTAPQYPPEILSPIHSGERDESEEESASEESADPEDPEENTENSEETEEAEGREGTEDTEDTEDIKDMEGTNKEKTTEELEEANENEAVSPEST